MSSAGDKHDRGETMSIKLQMDTEIGDLKASLFLQFCVRKIGPSIYNQAIADAQSYIQEKAVDLGGNRYEAEFDYWKK